MLFYSETGAPLDGCKIIRICPSRYIYSLVNSWEHCVTSLALSDVHSLSYHALARGLSGSSWNAYMGSTLKGFQHLLNHLNIAMVVWALRSRDSLVMSTSGPFEEYGGVNERQLVTW
jgi:hypothetical protein